MPVERLLAELLDREPTTDADRRPETAILHECRHCGSKFDDPITECPVCGAAEIATYEFPSDDSDAGDADAGDADAGDADAGDADAGDADAGDADAGDADAGDADADVLGDSEAGPSNDESAPDRSD